MTKRLTEKQREEIKISFTKGKSIEFLSEKFKCTKLTITRNLKKDLGELEYKEFIIKNKNIKDDKNVNNNETIDFSTNPAFFEIPPLDYEIENTPRKDLSSTPISEIVFPQKVYMIVDKKIELETKQLKDYPEWDFLPEEDLKIKTIEIYLDLKMAKRDCKKDQKVIKVPNPNVFKIASKIMISRGIARIICDKQLISL